MCPLLQVSRNKAVDKAPCGVSCLSGFCPFGVVGPGSFRRISMSLRGCECRLPHHRPLTGSKMPSRLCLRGCCCLLAFLVGHCGRTRLRPNPENRRVRQTRPQKHGKAPLHLAGFARSPTRARTGTGRKAKRAKGGERTREICCGTAGAVATRISKRQQQKGR